MRSGKAEHHVNVQHCGGAHGKAEAGHYIHGRNAAAEEEGKAGEDEGA